MDNSMNRELSHEGILVFSSPLLSSPLLLFSFIFCSFLACLGLGLPTLPVFLCVSFVRVFVILISAILILTPNLKPNPIPKPKLNPCVLRNIQTNEFFNGSKGF